jgi:hypothetical protein
MRPQRAAPGHSSEALSLVEVLIASAIGVVALTLLWQIVITGSRQSAKLSARLSAVQGAQLLIERIRQDATGLLASPGDTRPLVESVEGGRFNRLNLLVWSSYRYLERPEALYDPALGDESWIEAHRVSYRFDPKSRTISRHSPGRVEPLSFAQFLAVTFLAGGAASGAADASDALAETSITVEMQCVPEAYFRARDVPPSEVVVIPVTIPLLARSAHAASDLWSATWFHRAPRVLDSQAAPEAPPP